MSSTPSSASIQGLYLTLAPVAVIAAVYFIIFLVLRRSQRRYYAPRTYLGSLNENLRTPALPGGLLNWFGSFWKIPDTYPLQHQSLDAYLFLRYMKITVVLTFVGCLITWPVLFPVNATGGGGQKQLDILSITNVNTSTFKKRYRYFAHLFISWIYFGFLMYLIFRECVFYINLRQAFLLSPFYSQRLSSRTVLFTCVPEPLRDERRLRKIFGPTVKTVWLYRDSDQLDDDVEERDKAAYKLESAEVDLIKKANKERTKAIKNGANADDKPGVGSLADEDSGSIAARWLPRKKRPTHRTGKFGLYGPKVDSVDWARKELVRLNPKIEADQAAYRAGKTKANPACFIEFNTQADAERACQTVAHHEGLHMHRYIGITPKDVVWSSLKISWWQLVLRRYVVIAFICALIVFWAIPVAVVGAISNINYLEEKVHFLRFLKKVPEVIMGFITGLLPSVALSILMSLVPVIMRLCAKIAGEPSYSRIELFTQTSYFWFQVIQVFLVTTVSSSAAAVGAQLSDPSKVTQLLAANLPKASNVYMSYMIVQGVSVSAGVISQVVGFVIFTLMYKYLSGTPRSLYTKWTSLSAISWGSTLPVYTNIAVIAITYSCIAPLVLGWACLGMSLFYFAWRYNVLFVTDTDIDTRGLIYPKALKQLFIGIYLAELCMIGLFAVAVAPIHIALQVVFFVFTILFHISLNSALDPLLYNLPQSLMSEEQYRQGTGLGDIEAGHADGTNGVNPADAGVVTKNSTADSSAATNVVNEKGAFAANDQYHTGATAPATKGSFLMRFLKPWIFANYETQRSLVPPYANNIDYKEMYTDEVHREAYEPPSVGADPPLLWICEDPAGISKQEIAHSDPINPITDEGCQLSDKGKLEWDREGTRPPVWSEKVLY